MPTGMVRAWLRRNGQWQGKTFCYWGLKPGHVVQVLTWTIKFKWSWWIYNNQSNTLKRLMAVSDEMKQWTNKHKSWWINPNPHINSTDNIACKSTHTCTTLRSWWHCQSKEIETQWPYLDGAPGGKSAKTR